MSNLLVSGLCVTANRPAFLERAIAWWDAQTWPRKELIVVDGSRKELRLDLRGRHAIRHVILDPDLDMGAKHDLAVAQAQGDVLAYHDDDDWWSPRRLLKQLEPLALDRATISGIPRDLVVYLPSATFARFKPPLKRGRLAAWVGNGIDRWGEKPIVTHFHFHDGSALFARSVLRHGFQHPPVRVGQKVDFLNALIQAGEPWVAIPNDRLFVYVRHSSNTWQYVSWMTDEPAAAPRWIPDDVMAFWRKGAVA